VNDGNLDDTSGNQVPLLGTLLHRELITTPKSGSSRSKELIFLAFCCIQLLILGIWLGYAAGSLWALVTIGIIVGVLGFCFSVSTIVRFLNCSEEFVKQMGTAFSPVRNTLGLWRRPSGSLASLDGIRALAVTWVMVYHLSANLAPFFVFGTKNFNSLLATPPMQFLLNGDMGVDLFFALSGFLIMHLILRGLERDRMRCWLFIWHRWLRLIPAYVACIVLQIVTKGGGADMTGACKRKWWTNLLFINNYIEQLHLDYSDICMGQSWSIAVEFQFYLISPLIVYLTCDSKGGEWVASAVVDLKPYIN
jgi:hypothetical protein